MFGIYTERQMERELDRRICEINRLDHLKRRITELEERLYRFESMIYKPVAVCDELKRVNDV